MPHSSGGGFSGGGGSFGGIHKGNINSGRAGSSAQQSRLGVRRAYFPGARTFVFYRGMMPHYVYASVDLTDRKSRTRAILPSLLFLIPFLIIGVALIAVSFLPTSKLGNTEHYTSSVIDDGNLFDDTSELFASLNTFKEKTGITPVIVSTPDTSWKQNSTLETYAFNYYVDHYKDETHWVILLSRDEGNTYYFEGIQGDDTDGILTEQAAEKFNKTLVSNLGKMSDSPEKALSVTFDALSEHIMDWHPEIGPLIFGIILLAFVIVITVITLTKSGDDFSYDELKEVNSRDENGQPKTEKCEYCDGTYVVGTCSTCPHCGANLP